MMNVTRILVSFVNLKKIKMMDPNPMWGWWVGLKMTICPNF